MSSCTIIFGFEDLNIGTGDNNAIECLTRTASGEERRNTGAKKEEM